MPAMYRHWAEYWGHTDKAWSLSWGPYWGDKLEKYFVGSGNTESSCLNRQEFIHPKQKKPEIGLVWPLFSLYFSAWHKAFSTENNVCFLMVERGCLPSRPMSKPGRPEEKWWRDKKGFVFLRRLCFFYFRRDSLPRNAHVYLIGLKYFYGHFCLQRKQNEF